MQLQLLADDDARAGPVAAEPHRDLLVLDALGRRGRLEASDPRLRGPHLGRERVAAHRGAATVLPQLFLQPLSLLLPAPVQLVDAREAVVARFVPRRERPAVHPRRAPLDRDHFVGRGREQFAVVAHQQDRLGGVAGWIVRASACPRHRGSCRARRAAAHRRRNAGAPRARGASARHPRVSTAGGRPAVVVRLAHRDDGARVPEHFGVPATGVAPGGVGAGQRHAVRVARVARQRCFGGRERRRRACRGAGESARSKSSTVRSRRGRRRAGASHGARRRHARCPRPPVRRPRSHRTASFSQHRWHRRARRARRCRRGTSRRRTVPHRRGSGTRSR